MSEELTDFEMAQKWAEITIQRWEEKIAALNIHQTGELLRSFTAQVVNDAKGNPEKVLFTFLYYGKFSDMGVGKGVKIADVGRTRRKQKEWYSKSFYTEVQKLSRIMADRYGERALEAIKVIEMEGMTANTGI